MSIVPLANRHEIVWLLRITEGKSVMFIRTSFILTSVIIASLMTGCCCGPCGNMGGGGCVTDCNDCDGVTYGRNPTMASGPLQHLTMLRKSMVCGGGCGEVYYGEWQSTPPDACDPCCGDQFVGGATPCQPFCWQWRPGQLLYGFLSNVYGQRLCEGSGGYFDDCSCGGGVVGGYAAGCDTCGGGEAFDSGFGGGGCATCNSNHAAKPNTRIAAPQTPPTDHRTARANTIRRGIGSLPSSRTRYR